MTYDRNFFNQARMEERIKQSKVATAWLNQIQICCPFDSPPTVIDVEFAVDALGMSAHRAQADHELLGDLRPRQIGSEQAQHFQFTLAERLHEILDLGFWIWDLDLLH